jgi:hypothetical protein
MDGHKDDKMAIRMTRRSKKITRMGIKITESAYITIMR